eukprot:4290902-Pleurochrysis_carterae.AAC.1
MPVVRGTVGVPLRRLRTSGDTTRSMTKAYFAIDEMRTAQNAIRHMEPGPPLLEMVGKKRRAPRTEITIGGFRADRCWKPPPPSSSPPPYAPPPDEVELDEEDDYGELNADGADEAAYDYIPSAGEELSAGDLKSATK